ncbi:LysR family transcriptional regulator [Pseudomonas sp. RIT-PI-S]|uniref:LysR family transcriptional regulator n=1 Tax=Pseudomonas sp. RIT-PI-S TaxID=3035295 RepID=UPI0021D7F389|nr:LysR family transcriptional regulator [Pseudomonas sp. RIT-PI-S]
MSAVAWSLLATRVSGACLLLACHGMPLLSRWYRLVQADDTSLLLGDALTLGLGLFSLLVCPLLVAAGIWARLACLPIVLGLGAAFAFGQGGGLGWMSLLLLWPIAALGPGSLTLGRFSQQRRRPLGPDNEAIHGPGEMASNSPPSWNETRTL